MTHFVRGRKATASAGKYGQAQNQCDSQELPLYESLISHRSFGGRDVHIENNAKGTT